MDVSDLSKVPLLTVLPLKELEFIAVNSTSRRLDAGEIFVHRGAPACHLIVLHEGTVFASHDTCDGARLRFGTLAGPCVLDKAVVLAGCTHISTWTASTNSRIRLISRSIFTGLIDRNPGMRDHVLRYLSRQVRDARSAHVRLTIATPISRVARWLSESALSEDARVVLPGAQLGLSQELGLSRITVNRVLQTLSRRGAIRVEPGAVTLLDPCKLEAFITGD